VVNLFFTRGEVRRPWHSGAVTAPRKPKKSRTKDNVIALSRYRNQLAAGQRSRRADALFASSDPEAAIRALPPDEFFYVIHELGFPEAMEVLVHGTAEQVQTVLDFSVWERDRVAMDKADDWLAALVETPPETLGQWAQGIDVELLALLVRQRARIYDLSLEEEPDEPEGALWNTPDRLFALDILGEPDQVRVTQRLVDSLYRYSPVMMRRLLVGVRAENDAELEETAYRWRSGRMADLGFVDFHEALAVYQEIDPASVSIDAGPAPSLRPRGEPADEVHLRLPVVMAERLAGKTPFARAVAGLRSQEETADLHFALVALCNRALSADRVTPGEDEAIRTVLERVSSTLDLGIEFLARGDAERELAAVRAVPVLTLHRLGVSLAGKLRRLALDLVRKNLFAVLRPAIDIFEGEDAEILASLSRARPLFPRVLDNPPAAGERPFSTLADLATATAAVERAAAAVELLTGLGVHPSHLSPECLEAMASTASREGSKVTIDPTAVDTGSLARTVLVARLLGDPPLPLSALPAEAIRKFKQIFNSGPQLPERTAVQALFTICESIKVQTLEGARREVALRWIASLCPLGPVLGDAYSDGVTP
jgi:hypothetical protein